MNQKPITKIAFIGTGLMGAPMVRRLLMARFSLRVWNRTPDKLKSLIAAGAEIAESPGDAASNADAVFLCLSDSAAVGSVLFDDHGVAKSATPPPLLVDFSTIGPAHTLEFAKRLHEQCGTSWVDAPVSGGVTGAEQGRLVIFCGGSSSDIDRLERAFGVLAQRVTRIGELGAGQTLKLCNQLIVAANLVAIAESLALARASGLNLQRLPEALAGGLADSMPLQIFGRRMAAGVTSPKLGEIAMMLKDLNEVASLAKIHRTPLPMTAAALEIYRRAAAQGLMHEDLAALFALYRSPEL